MSDEQLSIEDEELLACRDELEAVLTRRAAAWREKHDRDYQALAFPALSKTFARETIRFLIRRMGRVVPLRKALRVADKFADSISADISREYMEANAAEIVEMDEDTAHSILKAALGLDTAPKKEGETP